MYQQEGKKQSFWHWTVLHSYPLQANQLLALQPVLRKVLGEEEERRMAKVKSGKFTPTHRDFMYTN